MVQSCALKATHWQRQNGSNMCGYRLCDLVPGPAHDTVDHYQAPAGDGLVNELCGPVEVPAHHQKACFISYCNGKRQATHYRQQRIMTFSLALSSNQFEIIFCRLLLSLLYQSILYSVQYLYLTWKCLHWVGRPHGSRSSGYHCSCTCLNRSATYMRHRHRQIVL